MMEQILARCLVQLLEGDSEIVNLDFEIIIGREKNELFGVSDDMFLKV